MLSSPPSGVSSPHSGAAELSMLCVLGAPQGGLQAALPQVCVPLIASCPGPLSMSVHAGHMEGEGGWMDRRDRMSLSVSNDLQHPQKTGVGGGARGAEDSPASRTGGCRPTCDSEGMASSEASGCKWALPPGHTHCKQWNKPSCLAPVSRALKRAPHKQPPSYGPLKSSPLCANTL